MFPREFKNWDIQNWVQIYQSVQSGVGKLSCNKTALLKHCTSTETLWNRKAPSLSSPGDKEIFLPKLPKSWHADVFKGPMVSTAIGAKRFCQCWHTFPPCGKRQALLQHLPRGRTQWRRIQPAALPWDECQTIRSLPVCAEQPWWLFCHGSSGWSKTSSDQVIESIVPNRPARCFSLLYTLNLKCSQNGTCGCIILIHVLAYLHSI